MANFDVDEYFDRRAYSNLHQLGTGATPDTSKYDDLMAASKDKLAKLAAITAEREANKDSLVSQWGLDSQSIAGKTINSTLAPLISGASRDAGFLASLPVNGLASGEESRLSQEHWEARDRLNKGIATPEDQAILNRKLPQISYLKTADSLARAQAMADSDPDASTALEVMERAQNLRGVAGNTTERFDLTKLVHQGDRNNLVHDNELDFEGKWGKVVKGWEQLSKGEDADGAGNLATGLAELGGTALKTAVTHPSAALGYVTENLPQLAMGLLGKAGRTAMVANNTGYGADLYRQGIENYQATHKGEYPPEELRQEMATNAGLAAAAEQASDLIGLGLIKAGGKPATDAARIGFKQALKNVGKAGAGGIASEAPTEGVQTYLEGEATLKPATAAQIFTGTTIGGIAGGGLSGGGRAIAEGARATPEHAEKRARDSVDHLKAIETGDVAAYLDTQATTFNPTKAAQALFGNSQLEATTPEAKVENLQKTNEILTGLENQRSTLQERSPESLAENQQLLAQQQAKLVAATAPKEKADAQEAIDMLQGGIDDINSMTPAQQKANKKSLARLDQQIDQVRQVKDELDHLVRGKAVNSQVTAQVALADTVPDSKDAVAVTAHREAIQNVINLSMASPDQLSHKAASQLANNTANALTPEQRSHLRAFSEARVAENTLKGMKEVSQGIYFGSKAKGKTRYVGIAEYNTRMAEAITTGNEAAAKRAFTGLRDFAKDHQAKSDMAQTALDTVKGRPAQIVRNKTNGSWMVSPVVLKRDEVRKNGGLTLNSPEMVRDIKTEAAALNTSAAALKSAYQLKFAPVNSATPVTQVADATSGTDPGQLQSKVDISVNGETASTPAPKGKQKRARRTVDVTKDSLFKAIAKLGGMDTLALTNNGFDREDIGVRRASRIIQSGKNAGKPTKPALYSRMMGFNLPLHRNGGMSFDAMLETLQQYGYFPETATLNDAIDAFRAELQGDPVFTASAIETAQDEQQAAYDAEMLAEQEANDSVEYTELDTTEERQVADDLAEAVLENDTEAFTDTLRTAEFTEEEINATLQDAFGDTERTPQGRSQSSDSQGENVEGSSATPEATQTTDTTETRESVEEAAPQGGLSIFTEQAKDKEFPADFKLGELYRSINKAVAFLTQRNTKVEQDSDIPLVRPLVAMQNLLSRWNAKEVVVEDFFPDGLIEPEQDALSHFQRVANKWAPLIRQNLHKDGIPNLKGVSVRPDFLYQDPTQDFFNKDGSLDENIVTAITYAAYNYLVDQMNAPALKDEEAILRMHGLKEGGISREGRRELGRMTSFKDTAAHSMGRYVIDALGLKVNDKAPTDYMNKLQTAFGLQGLVLLAQKEVDLIDLVTLDGAKLNGYLAEYHIEPVGQAKAYTNKQGELIEARPIYPTMTYIRIQRDEQLKLPVTSQAIKESSVQSQGVLQRLFGAEHSGQYATWKPTKFSQQKAKKTGQGISKKQRRILEKAQKVEHRVSPVMWDALTVLGDDVVLTAAGRVDETSPIQAENRDAVQAKNLGLVEQLSVMKSLVQGAIDYSPLGIQQPFFAALEVWRNYRVGVATRDMNLQSSKIHRFMFFRPEWESKINFKTEENLEQFQMAIAQAFGLKIDQQPNTDTLKKLDKLVKADSSRINSMALQLAKALETPQESILTAGQKQDIAEFTAGAEGMQTLQALVAWGKYLSAHNQYKADPVNGPQDVSVQLLVGVDGKTNGPILTYLALGAEASVKRLFAQINRGGMYRAIDKAKNYNHWYKRSTSLDLYEDLAHRILSTLTPSANLTAINVFTKQLIDGNKVTSAGRNLAKTPITSFIFGSSIDRSIEAMQQTFVQSVFDRIQAVASGQDTKTTRQDLIRGLNQLMGTQLSENTPIEMLLAKEFSDKEKQALSTSFYETLGIPIEETMQAYFETYIERRNNINKTIQATFSIYDTVYQSMYVQEMERLMDTGEIGFTEDKGQRVPIHTLTVAQEKELREKVKGILPLAHTAYTQGTDQLDAGLYMAKTKLGSSSAEHNRVKVLLGKLIPTGDNWRTNFIAGSAMQTGEVSPGVAGLPYFMHSLDSNGMHTSLEGTETLNVHDEAANGVGNIIRTAEAINHATFDTLLAFSPTTEAYEMLSRVLENVSRMAKAGELSAGALASIETILRKQLPPKVAKNTPKAHLATTVVKYAYTAQYQANEIRLGGLAEMTAIDQYTWEGGEYRVTDADRAKAVAALKQLREEAINPDLLKAAGELGKLFGTQAETQETPVAAEPTTSIWGTLGTPAIKSDKRLLDLFTTRKVVTAKQLFSFMDGRTGSEIDTRIWALMQKVVNPSLEIRLVTPDTDLDQVLEKGADTARGWFVSKDGSNAIYVLSPEFKYSGLQMEVLMHELLHASLAQTIEQAQKDKSGPAYELVQELETLRNAAQAYVTENRLSQFNEALVNVHELVAWGMSNKDFQTQVLQKLQMTSQNTGNVLVTAMQKFIQTITALLFDKRHQVLAENGMTVLVSNVSGLFHQASQNKEAKTADLNLSQNVPLNTYSTLDIYEALDDGTLVGDFDVNLRGLLDGMVTKLHGAFGTFKAARMENQAITPTDIWLKALDEGVAPFASKSLASGFKFSEQTAFVLEQVEATVRAALEGNEGQTTVAYGELKKLYQEVRDKLDPTGKDFNTGDPQQDQALYDFIFKMEKSNGDRSDYLARFAALGLAHEGFNSILQTATDSRTHRNPAKGFVGRLERIFEQVLEWFAGKMTDTYAGQQANHKLTALVDQLVGIEAKRKARLLATETGLLTPFEDALKGVAEEARKKVEAAGQAPFFKDSKNAFVAAAGNIASTVAGDRMGLLVDNFNRMRAKSLSEGLDMAGGIVNEIRGANDTNKAFHLLMREAKRREGKREDLIRHTADTVLGGFANKGEDLTGKDKAGLSAYVLRTDMSSLLDHFTMDEITTLATNDAALTAAIQKIEGQFKTSRAFRNAYIKQSRVLGYQMATGSAKGEHLRLNAYNIANLSDTPYFGRVSAAEIAAAMPLIDQLTTLNAMQHTKPVHKLAVRAVMKAEATRGKENGIELVLKLHKHLQQQSKERLFDNQDALMMKGYTPEIYNPHREVLVADAVEGAQLVRMGFSPGAVVKADPQDPDQTIRNIYTRDGGGLRAHLTGIFSYTGKRAKGSRAKTGNVKDLEEWVANRDDLQNMHTNKQADIRELFKDDPNFDPSKVKETYAAPVMNTKGQTVDYRYLMQEEHKDALLERDNRFDKVLGSLAGSIFDKETTKEINHKAVQALKDQYDAEYKTLSTSYVRISPDSPVAKFRDIYAMLPDDTKASILEVWGKEGMLVRVDLLDVNFGYRKLSLTMAFDKDEVERNIAEAFFVDLMTHIMGDKAAFNVRRIEDIWQELAHEVKDILVIKNVTTLIGNVRSNTSALLWMGVSPVDIIRQHRIALKGATAYRKDSSELASLQTQLNAGYTPKDVARMKDRIIELEDSLARNPVRELIDAGLMPSIVEDVDPENDLYSYKSRLVRKVEENTQGVNKTVLAAGRLVYMAKDTKMYQTLHHATQLSDFLARYTLYQHVTTRKGLPMAKAEAIQLASDAFVSYDIPSHRGVQYLNDMGLVRFTKYYLRIQKVIASLYKEKPGRAIALLSLEQYFGAMPTLMDSSFISHSGNPLEKGAFDYPGSLSELATVKMGMGLFK